MDKGVSRVTSVIWHPALSAKFRPRQ